VIDVVVHWVSCLVLDWADYDIPGGSTWAGSGCKWKHGQVYEACRYDWDDDGNTSGLALWDCHHLHRPAIHQQQFHLFWLVVFALPWEAFALSGRGFTAGNCLDP